MEDLNDALLRIPIAQRDGMVRGFLVVGDANGNF